MDIISMKCAPLSAVDTMIDIMLRSRKSLGRRLSRLMKSALTSIGLICLLVACAPSEETINRAEDSQTIASVDADAKGSVVDHEKTLDFEGEMERAVKALDATGLLAAAIIDGEIVFKGTKGKSNENTGAPIDTDMVFPIGSISKAFTTTALAILVDRGQVEWDEPLRTYIPEFKMADDWITDHFTVRDAVTHRSGLPLGAGDLLFWPDATSTIDDFIAAMPHLPQAYGFRAKYAYDNLLYSIAGEVVARVSGKSWADFVSDEIMTPLDLDGCAANLSKVPVSKAIVTGHERAAGASVGTPISDSMRLKEVVDAAGGVYCSLDGIMAWAQFWLNDGESATGVRIVSEEQIDELLSPVIPIAADKILGKSGLVNLTNYALGWFIRDFNGTKLVEHAGGVAGVGTRLFLFPDKQMAFFAITNDYRSTGSAWVYQMADDAIGGREVDFIKALGDRQNERTTKALTQLDDALAPPEDAIPPSLPLSAYAGVYRDPWYGLVSVTEEEGGLLMDMKRSNLLTGPLSHYDGETFSALWPNRTLRGDAFVTFELSTDDPNAEGSDSPAAEKTVIGIKMKAISEFTDFSFDFHDLDLKRVN
ncbi:MAG: serine hydrolase [Pseudomonadota bacterium]